MKTRVEMPESILSDPENWRWEEDSHYMSGHMYRGTAMEAFETIDSCGNCDGARCETCEEKTISAHWEVSVNTDELYEALVATGLEDGVAADLAYNDFGCKTHWLDWDCKPSKEMLKQLEAAKK